MMVLHFLSTAIAVPCPEPYLSLAITFVQQRREDPNNEYRHFIDYEFHCTITVKTPAMSACEEKVVTLASKCIWGKLSERESTNLDVCTAIDANDGFNDGETGAIAVKLVRDIIDGIPLTKDLILETVRAFLTHKAEQKAPATA